MEPVEGMEEAPCPLCGEAFNDDAAYAGHLADEHGLVDDDGAETTVELALIVSGIAGDRVLATAAAEEAAASKAVGNREAETTVHPSRIYDPHGDDSRLRPLVLGLAGILLLGAIGLGLAGGLGGGDDADDDGVEVATADGDDDGAVAGGEDPGVPPTLAGEVAVADPALTAVTEPVSDTSAPPAATGPTTTPPTTAPPPLATTPPPSTPPPPPTAPPTTPPPTAPPTTAQPPFAAPALSGARIDSCQRSGPDATWTFSYVLLGGSGWAPAPGATAVGGGRYSERRTGKASRGFPSTSIQVFDVATGQARPITLSPSLAGAGCR